MIVKLGPTGSIIRGSVLDVNKRALEEKLRDYDPLLYLRWNPRKLQGYGVWELRRRPEKKSVKSVDHFGGNSIVVIDYVEVAMVNHVKDFAYLNYGILKWLQDHDQFKHNLKYWGDQVDANLDRAREDARLKAREEMRYTAKQNRREIRGMMELVRAGKNPAWLADYWK